MNTAPKQLSLSEPAHGSISSIIVPLSSAPGPHLLPSHPLYSLVWHFSHIFLPRPQKCCSPDQIHRHLLQAGLIVASSKCLHSLLKSYYCPHIQPFALSPFPRLLSEALPAEGCLPVSWAAAAEWWHQEESWGAKALRAPPLWWLGTAFRVITTPTSTTTILPSRPPIQSISPSPPHPPLWDSAFKTTSSWEQTWHLEEQEKDALQGSSLLPDDVIQWLFKKKLWDLQDTQQPYLWIWHYCNSHPDLQLSGLMSSCRITYCLPSGLQFLSHCNDPIPPSHLGSESKHTLHMHNACYPDPAGDLCRLMTVRTRHWGGI